jgi:ApbE superfamily uncharacterized protein (UPF0280 family)
VAARLPDGRLHLHEGPIDLILAAEGPAREAAERAAIEAFDGLLPELVRELPVLRSPMREGFPDVSGPIARRMVAAVRPYGDEFVTPMAAVAGSVADHILAAMLEAAPNLTRAWVNDGGDIALHLTPGTEFKVGLVPDLAAPRLAGHATVRHGDGVGGVATSGRGGRSFSLGIADAVTVLAATAAAADVAATLIANAVDLPGHPAILREPATLQDPDSDLGDRHIVRSVGALDRFAVDSALNNGANRAQTLLKGCPLTAAVLWLQGECRVIGALETALVAADQRADDTNRT